MLFALECALAVANASVRDIATRIDREIALANRWVGSRVTYTAVARANRDLGRLARAIGGSMTAGDPAARAWEAQGARNVVADLVSSLREALYGALFRLELWWWAAGRSWWLSGALWFDARGVGRASPATTPMGAFRRRRATRWLTGGYVVATIVVLQWPWRVHPALPAVMAWMAMPLAWLVLRNARDD